MKRALRWKCDLLNDKISSNRRKMRMHIELMTQVSDEVMTAFERLLPQLTRHSPPPTRDELARRWQPQAQCLCS
jgi:hypothetical protein